VAVTNARLEIGLREKTDRTGKRYLFGALPFANLVIFVYDDGPDADGVRRHSLQVRPYRPGDDDEPEQPFAEPWRSRRRAR
jgi:hypothetical protein